MTGALTTRLSRRRQQQRHPEVRFFFQSLLEKRQVFLRSFLCAVTITPLVLINHPVLLLKALFGGHDDNSRPHNFFRAQKVFLETIFFPSYDDNLSLSHSCVSADLSLPFLLRGKGERL